MFKKPMQDIREGLETLDKDCPNTHFSRPYKEVEQSECEAEGQEDSGEECSQHSDKECSHAHVFPSSEGEHNSEWDVYIPESMLCRELMGHPLPCSKEECGSKLFSIRAASVHYPKLRSFLRQLYHA